MSKLKSPKWEEELVGKFLSNEGYTDVEYEPEGNVTPDILVNGTIAIEVRRLNENFKGAEKHEGLETKDTALRKMFTSLTKEVTSSEFDHSAIILYHFKRPLRIDKNLRNRVKQVLIDHLPKIDQGDRYVISENLQIDINPIRSKYDTIYRSGIYSDNNSGGDVSSILYENLQIALREKERKVLKFRSKYPEWWLALVNFIAFFDEFELKAFYELPRIQTDFDKILIVSPENPDDGFFLYEDELFGGDKL